MADSIILKEHPKKCIDLKGGDTTNGNTLQIWDCWETHGQGWVFKGDQLAYKNNTDKCIDLKDGNTDNGNALQIWDCHAPDHVHYPHQQWVKTMGEFKVWYKASEGTKCFDLPNADTRNGVELQIWDCNGMESQHWALAGEDLEDSVFGYILAITVLSVLLCFSFTVICFMGWRQRKLASPPLKDPTSADVIGQPQIRESI